jgi:hypothetical protein
MPNAKHLFSLLILFLLISCKPNNDLLNTEDHIALVVEKSADEVFWEYQLAKMGETTLSPSLANEIRIIITFPFGGRTTVIHSICMGEKYQVIKKLADGRPNDMAYETIAKSYNRDDYSVVWMKAIAILEQSKLDSISKFSATDFAIASIELVDRKKVVETQFLFCGHNAESIIKISNILLVDRNIGLDTLTCP